MLAAQFGLDLKLLLRNGEQLLLTMFVPITLLIGSPPAAARRLLARTASPPRPGDHGPGGDLHRLHRPGDRGGVRPPLRRP